jgi:hypothetical protein
VIPDSIPIIEPLVSSAPVVGTVPEVLVGSPPELIGPVADSDPEAYDFDGILDQVNNDGANAETFNNQNIGVSTTLLIAGGVAVVVVLLLDHLLQRLLWDLCLDISPSKCLQIS